MLFTSGLYSKGFTSALASVTVTFLGDPWGFLTISSAFGSLDSDTDGVWNDYFFDSGIVTWGGIGDLSLSLGATFGSSTFTSGFFVCDDDGLYAF